jgi:hypothetical protein
MWTLNLKSAVNTQLTSKQKENKEEEAEQEELPKENKALVKPYDKINLINI